MGAPEEKSKDERLQEAKAIVAALLCDPFDQDTRRAARAWLGAADATATPAISRRAA